MSTEVAIVENVTDLAPAYTTDLADFTKPNTFFPQLRLANFSSDIVKDGKVSPKDWYIKTGKDDVKVLGQTVVVKPLVFRFTALDFREKDKVKRYHDPNSVVFKEVKAVGDNHPKGTMAPCTAGLEFLFATKDDGLVTILLGSTSWKMVAETIEGIRKQSGFLTFGSTLVNGKFKYLAPTVKQYVGAFEFGDVLDKARAFAAAEGGVEPGDARER